MPPICSPTVRPGRSAEVAPVISKRLSDTILSSGIIDLKELCLISGKAAWMAYLDIYCLDAALISAAAAFLNLQIPVVTLNDNGRIVSVIFLNLFDLTGDHLEKPETPLLTLDLLLLLMVLLFPRLVPRPMDPI